MKILLSDLSSGGSPGSDQDSDLVSKLELELIGSQTKTGFQTFPPNHLKRVRSGRQSNILLISFLYLIGSGIQGHYKRIIKKTSIFYKY